MIHILINLFIIILSPLFSLLRFRGAPPSSPTASRSDPPRRTPSSLRQMEHDLYSSEDTLPENANVQKENVEVNLMEPTRDDYGSGTKESIESEQAMIPRVNSANTSSDVFVYRQDVVGCSKYEGLLGVVMEVAGDSDSEGSIRDGSDSEDDRDRNGDVVGGDNVNVGDESKNHIGDEDDDSLQDGQVRIIWTDGSETTDKVSDVTIVDRSFFHGDIVASVSNPTGQLGLVVDVKITVDLLASNGEVIKQISSKDLKRIREFSIGDYVVRGPWLGRVDDVFDNVTILFDDGSVCKVVKADPLRLQPVLKPVIDDADCPYHPGQRVRAVSSSVFKSSRWLSGLWKAHRLEGTVIKVQTASVMVYWIASAHLGVGTNSSAVPSEEQNPKDLTLLHCFSYANWQLGDWCLFPSSSDADGTSESSSLKATVGGSPTNHSKDLTLLDYTYSPVNRGIKSSGQDLDSPELVDKGLRSSETKYPITAVVDETLDHTPTTISGVNDLQLVSGQISSSDGGSDATSQGLDGNFQSENVDSMGIDKTVKLGESSRTGLIDTPQEDGCCDSSLVTKEAVHESWPSYRRKLRKVLFKRDKKTRRRDETFERALFIINTMTKVDVAWQDGTKQYDVDSKSLLPIQSPSDHEFFPEQYVVEKVSSEYDDSLDTKRVGIVRSVNSKDRTVCVRWLKPVSRPEDLRQFDCDEVVSAYELDVHPDYDYCYGDVVVRLSPVSVPSTTADLDSTTGEPAEQLDQLDQFEADADAIKNPSNYDQAELLLKDEDCTDFTSLSWVGNITGLQDGDIEVTWADGMVSKVGPQAIYVVGRDDDGDSFGGGSEVSDTGASWETVDGNETDMLITTEKEGDLESPSDNSPDMEGTSTVPVEDSNIGRSGPLSVPLAALGFVTRLATGLFSLGRKEQDIDDTVADGNESQDNLEDLDNRAADDGSIPLNNALYSDSMQDGLQNADDNHVAVTKDNEVLDMDDIDNSVPVGMHDCSSGADNKDDHCNFKHFDVAESPLDHYFLGSNAQSNGGRKWAKKVQQEWSILEKNLPDAIYVRLFEDRMDLLRAVIVGACGTPYQDGLFFFDFHLPPEYPQVPPTAYYHSGGLRINPNLYVDGKVCLSLLNTWTGKGNEVWEPSTSSILQVLVSLQGLVLNSKPYFNEAGYEKQVGTIEGEKNCIPYNENTYLLNLKSMMYLLRRPPMHFESFVKDHFRSRGHYILKACQAYMSGCLIGSLTKDACMTEKSKDHTTSVGFKLMLAKLLPRLIAALTEVGVDCKEFENINNS
ncbi:putative ubiquitin-conjugating enzyme E2 23 [Iris pallida]|uniref:E2 ubiquitin-conjugating enzyme n=1 Tax=Iris pallida TaxID=29817 RepID=A0AAX6HC13_IRIPA|nr:putative ubiquitin-conjugating enzyme E2 23 [Iris pallida]